MYMFNIWIPTSTEDQADPTFAENKGVSSYCCPYYSGRLLPPPSDMHDMFSRIVSWPIDHGSPIC